MKLKFEIDKVLDSASVAYDEFSASQSSMHRQSIETAIGELDQLAIKAGLSTPEIILCKAGTISPKRDEDGLFTESYKELYTLLDNTNKVIRKHTFSQLAEGKEIKEIASNMLINKSEIYRIAMV